mmetsp:Transcript_52942/g.137971  ORF Transcript_52942/g.137971 Transcript_52942/m.137971 type:complete len:212 (-) Transcript_52942:20-655(-)
MATPSPRIRDERPLVSCARGPVPRALPHPPEVHAVREDASFVEGVPEAQLHRPRAHLYFPDEAVPLSVDGLIRGLVDRHVEQLLRDQYVDHGRRQTLHHADEQRYRLVRGHNREPSQRPCALELQGTPEDDEAKEQMAVLRGDLHSGQAHERPVVTAANGVVQPDAPMVEFIHACTRVLAVLGAWPLEYPRRGAEPLHARGSGHRRSAPGG